MCYMVLFTDVERNSATDNSKVLAMLTHQFRDPYATAYFIQMVGTAAAFVGLSSVSMAALRRRQAARNNPGGSVQDRRKL